MTVKELYLSVKEILAKGNIPDPAFEAAFLMEETLGYSRSKIIVFGDSVVSALQQEKLLDMAKRRADGEPLQYITGKWYFMDIPFEVGYGVLIPREDTQVCVDICIEELKKFK